MPDRIPPLTVAEMFFGGGCQFIDGDIHAEHSFCGEPKHSIAAGDGKKDLLYCAAHAARCYLGTRKPPGLPREEGDA